MSKPNDSLAVSCPCGASLAYVGDPAECAKRHEEFNNTHRYHTAPGVYRYQDHWRPYYPRWDYGDTITRPFITCSTDVGNAATGTLTVSTN